MSDRGLALVVDDHPTNRLLATALLKKMGWQVIEATNGEEALTMAGDAALRLVLLDISMPGLSGEETCARLRSMEGGQQLRIVAYTAHAFQEDLDKLLAEGFDAALIKPISLQKLEEVTAAPGT